MKENRVIFLALFLSSALLNISVSSAQDTPNPPHSEQISAPACQSPPDWDTARATTCPEAEIAAWLDDIKHWRA
jgi:hypothetical protein